MLTILSLNAQYAMRFATCTGILVELATSMLNSTFGRTSTITFNGIDCPCRTTVSASSRQSSPVRFDKNLTFPMYFGFSQVCLATCSSTCVLVAVIFAGAASEAVSVLTFTSASVFSREVLILA